MKKDFIACLIIGVCFLAFIGCDSTGEKPKTADEIPSTETGPGEVTSPGSPETVLPGGQDPGETVATVNGVEIDRGTVEQEKNTLMKQLGRQVSPQQMAGMMPRLWRQALENRINQVILLQEAEKLGIKGDKEAVEERIGELQNRFSSPADFWSQLAQAGVTEEELRKGMEEGIIIETLIDRELGEGAEISDEEISDYYENNPQRFESPERVRASHILIKTDPSDSAEAKEEKRAQLAGLKEEISEGGDFAALAKEHSGCPSSARGGDLGFFERGRMVKPFEEAAFGMKVGEVSDIVETQFGYHLITLTERREAETVSLEDAKERISTFLYNQKKEQAVGDYLVKLRDSASIEYSE